MKRIAVIVFDDLKAACKPAEPASATVPAPAVPPVDAAVPYPQLTHEYLAAFFAASRPKVERAMARAMVCGARVVMARSFSDRGAEPEGER